MSQYAEGFGVVYMIKNKINNRVYIGQTTQYKRRKKDHFKELSKNKHINCELQQDYNKYGNDAFEISILKECCNLQERLDFEKYYIDYYGGINSSNTYNMTDKCNLNKKVKLSISKSHIGKKHTKLSKSRLSNIKLNFYKTADGLICKEKISNGLKDYYKTDEGIRQRNVMSNRAKELYCGEKNPMYGKHHSKETRQKISETKKSRKIIPYNKGKKGLYKHSEKTKSILKEKSTKYSEENIDELRRLYDELGTYSAVAKVKNMNSNIVSRLIRFGTTACYK